MGSYLMYLIGAIVMLIIYWYFASKVKIHSNYVAVYAILVGFLVYMSQKFSLLAWLVEYLNKEFSWNIPAIKATSDLTMLGFGLFLIAIVWIYYHSKSENKSKGMSITSTIAIFIFAFYSSRDNTEISIGSWFNFGTITQTNVIGGDATKENQDEILKLLRRQTNGQENEWLQKYFGDDWEAALKNHQTYTNLKKKLINSSKSLEELIKEKEEILAKFSAYHLNDTVQDEIDSAVQELRYDDAEKLLTDYLNSTDKVAEDRVKAHYQKALVHLEQIEYYKAKDEIENIPSKKVEDPVLLNDYAYIYNLYGEYKEALPMFEKALKIRQDMLGEEHPSTAISYNNLASLNESIGEYAKALPLYEKALNIHQKILGEEHLSTATSYNNLAGLYQSVGEYTKALPLYKKSLKIHQKILGEEHPNTATTYNNLASLYQSMGEYVKALPLYEKALKTRQNMLGEEHPNTATTYNNLASLYQSMGEYAKALPLCEKDLRICQNTLGEEHPNTAISYGNLAALYESMGEYTKALPLYEKALKIHQNVLGEEHPDTATSYNNLAVFYNGQHNFLKAYKYMQKSVNIYKKILPQNHPNLINLLKNLEAIKTKI